MLAPAESLTAAALLALLGSQWSARAPRSRWSNSQLWWSASSGVLRLIRDRFGMEPLCYWHRAGNSCSGSRGPRRFQHPSRQRAHSPCGVWSGISLTAICRATTRSSRVCYGAARLDDRVLAHSRILPHTELVSPRFRTPCLPMKASPRGIASCCKPASCAGSVQVAGIFLSGGMDCLEKLRCDLCAQAPQWRDFRLASGALARRSTNRISRQLAKELGATHTEVDYGEQQSAAGSRSGQRHGHAVL